MTQEGKFRNLNNHRASEQSGGLTVSRKIVEEFEKEKKQPKTQSYYRNLLKAFEEDTIEKMAKIVAIISEEISIHVPEVHNMPNGVSIELPPYLLEIENSKFVKGGLLLSDVEKILNLFTTPKFLLFPESPKKEDLPPVSIAFFIYSPINGWDEAAQDLIYQYPYEGNFKTFKEAVLEFGDSNVDEKAKNNTQILAEKLNKEFANDKMSIEASRAWFKALVNNDKPALEKYQQAVAQTLINLEPFRRRLAENAKIINQISQNVNVIMPNLEAVKPMLKEIEDAANRVSELFDQPQKLMLTAPLPPRISEAIQRNEMVGEIRALRKEVEKLTDNKTLATPQKSIEENTEIQAKQKDKNFLKSIHLVTNSLEPKSVIFLVLDEQFEMPVRCAVNNKKGTSTYIKKLYDIAYAWDVPNKKVGYDKSLADNINNGLFKKGRVAKYMRTNKLKKPTLVKKSEDGKSLVLKNDVPVKTGLVKHDVPIQHQSLYVEKTK